MWTDLTWRIQSYKKIRQLTAVVYGFQHLVDHPEVMAKVRAEQVAVRKGNFDAREPKQYCDTRACSSHIYIESRSTTGQGLHTVHLLVRKNVEDLDGVVRADPNQFVESARGELNLLLNAGGAEILDNGVEHGIGCLCIVLSARGGYTEHRSTYWPS